MIQSFVKLGILGYLTLSLKNYYSRVIEIAYKYQIGQILNSDLVIIF